MRTHTGEKPRWCAQGGKAVLNIILCTDHMKVHTGVRPFLCSYYDKALKWYSTHSPFNDTFWDETNMCNQCGKTFASKKL